MLDRGRPPPWYKKERVVLLDWGPACFFLEAFLALSSSRAYGPMGGMYSIPWDKVMYYGEVMGLDRKASIWLWEMVHQVDCIYVKRHNEELTANRPAASDRQSRGSIKESR